MKLCGAREIATRRDPYSFLCTYLWILPVDLALKSLFLFLELRVISLIGTV